MATLKPTTPLRAPNKGPLKPTSPLHPNTAPKTPISHPHRRQGFQSHTSTSEQRQWRFQTTAHLADRARRRHPWVAAGPGRASRRRTEPDNSDPAPQVWRAPEGPEGQAAVPEGGGRARAGLEIDHSEPQARVWRSRGRAAAHRHTQRPGPPAPGTPAAPHATARENKNRRSSKDLRFHRARGGS